MKMIPTELNRKNQFLGGHSNKNKLPMFTGKHMMFFFLYFCFSSSIRLRSTGCTRVTYLMSSCTTTTSRCSVSLVKNDQVNKSTLMKHAKTLHQQDLVLKKEPRRYQRLRTTVSDIREEQQHVEFSERAIKRQQQHTLQKELKNNAKIVDLGCQKARARKADTVHSNMTRQRKEKAKGSDQEAWFKETMQQNDNMPERQGKMVGSSRFNGGAGTPCTCRSMDDLFAC